jgi:hypothetical protein
VFAKWKWQAPTHCLALCSLSPARVILGSVQLGMDEALLRGRRGRMDKDGLQAEIGIRRFMAANDRAQSFGSAAIRECPGSDVRLHKERLPLCSRPLRSATFRVDAPVRSPSQCRWVNIRRKGVIIHVGGFSPWRTISGETGAVRMSRTRVGPLGRMKFGPAWDGGQAHGGDT